MLARRPASGHGARTHETLDVEDRRKAFPVADLALTRELEHLRPGRRPDLDEFIGLARVLAFGEAGRHEEVDALVGEPRGRVDRREALDLPGAEPGLLA